PSVTYSEPGDFTVTLVAHNAYGDDTETKTGYITVVYPDIVMSNQNVYVCGGTYKDPGGDDDYGNSLSYTQTIYPATSGAKVRLTFTEFSLEAASSSGWGGSGTCYDKLYIYDGVTTSTTAIVNGVCGTDNPGTITATNASGALTIMFTSDQSVASSGWVAEISCYVPGPEVEVQSYTPTTAQYNTTNDLNVVFTNTGVGTTSANTTATISTTDEYLTLNSTSAILGAIASNATATGTFNFSLAENVPDGHVATINVEITDGSSTWNETVTITAIGPACDAPTGLQVAVNNTDATITWDTQTITSLTISDDFEDHTYGTINSPGTVGWTYIDGDGSPTGGISYYTLTNSGSEMAFIVVDPTQVTYTSNTSQTLASRAGVTAHSGTQFIASFYNAAQNNVTLQNDDWIVSPQLNFAEEFTFSFYCRGGHRSSNTSFTETYEVYYSTTTNDESAFTHRLDSTTVTGGNNVQWTYKTYTVPSTAKYVAIRYASDDKYYFCIDDITISGNAISGAAA
ncbi:MAG: choice-of-anchor J domain-containing protein, partial [Bacteroidales bacterium]|nr:choice-of-anchor J domain-containing protein [Bacteroidales bacterium]